MRGPLSEALAAAVTPEWLAELLSEVKGRTKGAWAYCPDCRKKVQCEVSDVSAIVKTVVELVEQVEGRPGTAGVDEAGLTLVVERRWPSASEALNPPLTLENHTGVVVARASDR